MVRRDILEVAAEFPRIIFPIFSNGTLLDDSYLSFFYKHQHLIPVISLEGRELETDARRGDGIYQNYLQLVPKLKQHKLFWGSSFTLTRENYNQVLSHEFLSAQLALGAELYFFVEYVPIASGTESLVLSSWQKENVTRRVDRLNKDLPGIFIAFPGDEEQYGGCLAAGRGFLHVNPFGLAEACPFAPVSDVNLSFSTLRESLSSRLMEMIRQNHSLLKEGEGGCALWAN
ncbi:MAG: radical SAM protein, partial [Tenericutes bacterium HGW-Tenericutes-3]